MAKKKKGRTPDYSGDGIAIWENTDKNGNTYLTEGECVIIKPKSWTKCRLLYYDNAVPVIDELG